MHAGAQFGGAERGMIRIWVCAAMGSVTTCPQPNANEQLQGREQRQELKRKSREGTHLGHHIPLTHVV